MAMKELNIRNKRARFEFHLDEVFEAGIVLTGTEIKVYATEKPVFLSPTVCLKKGKYGCATCTSRHTRTAPFTTTSQGQTANYCYSAKK